MNANHVKRSSARRVVLLALALVIVLAGSLALRLVNEPVFTSARAEAEQAPVMREPLRWTGGAPRTGVVHEPRSLADGDLDFPEWARPGYDPPIRFQTDLDLIAPLGDGPENAALWFGDFARPSGAREPEYDEAVERGPDRDPGEPGPLLAPDDPLLLEAEPWVDQATMHFYPEVWEPDGWNTQIPNLLMTLTLARSWAARADATEDAGAALADYRRAIRLGRLLRQEDATLITDLVGLACIRIGLDGVYRRQVALGDTRSALVTALALGEHAPQRLKTSEIFTSIEPSRYLSRGWFGVDVRMSDDVFARLTSMAKDHPDRRFRLEAILSLNVARFEGTAAQRRETAALLEELAAGDDIWVSDLARYALETPPDLEQFASFD
jgi:hypothetical protein